jgi:polar amino acid transport system substrate-binding protein
MVMRRSQPLSRLAATLVFGAMLAAPIRGGAEVPATIKADVQPLRVCADPDDLPFSSAKSGASGLYIEIGQQVAQALGRPFEPVWALSYFGKRAVRTTLLAKTCDAYVGLPGIEGFMGPQLVYSKPFLHIGYAIMALAGEHITRMDDLSGKRVAVQFSTPPQIVLANRDDVHAVTFLNPEDAAQALARHDVDVAFIWGPAAGYLNTTAFHDAYQITPVSGDGM